MNEERIAVLMDTGGDLPADLCAREGIEILPLHVIYPEKDYLDGLNINPMMVYDRFPDEIPSTSTPSIQEVLDKFREIAEKGYNKLIVITISSALSSTGHTVSIAARDYPDLEIHVFDTRNISFGSGIFALWAARRIREGVSFRDLVDQLYAKRGASRQFFYMDTLKYLRHGGRIGRVASFIGEALHLKPIISCDPDGVYYTVAKIRGAALGRRRLLEEVERVAGDKRCWIIVGEGAAHEEAMKMKDALIRRLPNMEYLFDKQINATLAINTGPGLVGVMVFVEP